MAENECWLAVELSERGDANTVVEAVREKTKYRFRGREEDGILVIHGRTSSFGDVKGPLQSVADHLERLVFVGCVEGGGGATLSQYFADATDLADPTEELKTTPGRYWAGQHFDYYATKYDIRAAV